MIRIVIILAVITTARITSRVQDRDAARMANMRVVYSPESSMNHEILLEKQINGVDETKLFTEPLKRFDKPPRQKKNKRP